MKGKWLLTAGAMLFALGIGILVSSVNPMALATVIPPGTLPDETTFTQGTSGVTPGGCIYIQQSSITNLSSGQLGGYLCAPERKLIVFPYALPENLVNGNTTSTDTSDHSVIASAGTGLKNCITGGSVSNTGSTTTLITLKDGSGGSTLWTTIAPSGGGSNFKLPTAVCGSAATAVYFAAASASTTVYIALTGYKGS